MRAGRHRGTCGLDDRLLCGDPVPCRPQRLVGARQGCSVVLFRLVVLPYHLGNDTTHAQCTRVAKENG